jgi:hypothetical protein
MEPSTPNHRPAGIDQISRRHRRRTTSEPKSTGKSAVTNGSKILLPPTERAWIRRLTDLLNLHVNDAGGWDAVSNAEAAIIRRAVTLIVELERRETEFARTACVDDAALLVYGTSANTLRRLLESVGLRPDPARAKTIRPLTDILAELDPEKSPIANGAGDGH